MLYVYKFMQCVNMLYVYKFMQCVNMLYDYKNVKNKETVFLQQTLIFLPQNFDFIYILVSRCCIFLICQTKNSVRLNILSLNCQSVHHWIARIYINKVTQKMLYKVLQACSCLYGLNFFNFSK